MFHSLPQNTQPNAKFSFNVTFSLQQLSELLKLPNDEEDNDDKNKKANDDRKKTRLTYIATVWIQVFFFFFKAKGVCSTLSKISVGIRKVTFNDFR